MTAEPEAEAGRSGRTARRGPLWQAIAATLRAELAAGIPPPGERLPSEAALAARFGVNRHTLRRAIAALAEEGIVHPRQGAGVFAAARPTDYPLRRRMRFGASLAALGRVPGRRLIRVETVPAEPAEAEALALPAGAAVTRAEGLLLADGVVIGHARAAFPGLRLPGLAAALGEGLGVTEALARCGVPDHLRAWTRIAAVPAEALIATHLRLRPGAPVLRAEALNTDAAGIPVEYGVTHFAGDRVTLTVAPEP